MSIKSMLVAVLTSAALAAPAAANVQVGASGWQWGDPLPQGNTLNAASFAGATGYAAGNFGTLLKTTDGGSTWSGLRVGTFEDLRVVQAVDANTVVAGGGCVARRSTDGGASFTSIAFTPVESSCRAELVDMSFLNANLGFLLLSDGSVLTTPDGGVHFSPRTAIPGTDATGGNADPTSIAFTGPATGYAVTTEGKVFQTTDGAVSWKVVASGAPRLQRIWFFDAAHGFAVGRSGAFLRTVDGGQTWTPKDLGVPGSISFTAIRCATTQLCLLSTANGTELVRTTDAGNTHGAVISPSTDHVLAAAFASATRVAAVGANGATVVSDDGGQTFSPIGARLAGHYVSLRAGGQRGMVLALGTAGALAKTTNGGRNWSKGNVPTSGRLVDASFPTATTGFALDEDGGVFATADGGGSWKTLNTGTTAPAQAVYAPNASTVLVVGPRGIRRSTDGGGSFAPIAGRAVARASLADVSAAPGGALFAWGRTTLLRSLNGGRSWTALGKPGANARARRRFRFGLVAFSSSTTGLLLDEQFRMWRTTNAGRRWSRLTSVGTHEINAIAVGSARAAYLVADNLGSDDHSYLLRTDDGGATWRPQFVVSDNISDIVATPGGTDYLLGGDAELLFSTTGGNAGAKSALSLSTRSRRLRRAATITISGRLSPAHGNEQVVISRLPANGDWSHQTVQVAANGTFVSSWRVGKGTTTFVAQWAGDVASAGAGSKVLTVTVSAAKPKRKPGGRH